MSTGDPTGSDPDLHSIVVGLGMAEFRREDYEEAA